MSDPKDYAHVHDAQAQRTRWEMWAILAVVVVVIFGALVWRAVKHEPAAPQRDWDRPNTAGAPAGVTPAAAAGVHAGTAPAPASP